MSHSVPSSSATASKGYQERQTGTIQAVYLEEVSPERAARFAKALDQSESQFVRLALQDQVRSAGLHLTVDVKAA